jgi:hypothetical protein
LRWFVSQKKVSNILPRTICYDLSSYHKGIKCFSWSDFKYFPTYNAYCKSNNINGIRYTFCYKKRHNLVEKFYHRYMDGVPPQSHVNLVARLWGHVIKYTGQISINPYGVGPCGTDSYSGKILLWKQIIFNILKHHLIPQGFNINGIYYNLYAVYLWPDTIYTSLKWNPVKLEMSKFNVEKIKWSLWWNKLDITDLPLSMWINLTGNKFPFNIVVWYKIDSKYFYEDGPYCSWKFFPILTGDKIVKACWKNDNCIISWKKLSNLVELWSILPKWDLKFNCKKLSFSTMMCFPIGELGESWEIGY